MDEDLLVLADRYLPNTLKVTCSDAILKRLNISNCISCFIIADRFFLPDSKLRKMLDLYTRCKAEQKGRPYGPLGRILKDLLGTLWVGRVSTPQVGLSA